METTNALSDNDIVIGTVVTTLFILLLVLGIFIAIYLAGKNRAIQELTYERELRKVETEVSEHLMERVAQELHDNIGHILTCMRITIENKKMDNPDNNYFAPIEGYLDEASSQVKLLSRSMNTDFITNIGLKSAIMLEVERINHLKRGKIVAKLDGGDTELDKNFELVVFRIFQEMMQNSLKHSKAKNIEIQLNTQPNFELIVKDDGKGFDVQKVIDNGKASGLLNMQKRALFAGLEYQIISSAGNGCTYIIKNRTA